MADPQTTDGPVKHQDVAPDAKAVADANTGASSKGLSDVQSSISGPAKPADGTQAATTGDGAKTSTTGDAGKTSPTADNTKPTDNINSTDKSDSGFDVFADIACSAWDSTASTLTKWADNAGSSMKSGFLDLAADTSMLTGWGTPESGFDFSKYASGDKPSVNVADGHITADNKTLTATGDGHGNDTVTNKGTGEQVSRNANGEITDRAADQTTTINKNEIDTHVAGMDVRRQTSGDLPKDFTDLKPGQAMTGANGVVYRATSYNDAEGGGTAIAGTDGTITMEGKNGDKLVLNTQTKQVDFTDAGKPTEHMTLAEFKQKYGESEFHGFKINKDMSIDNHHDHVHMAAMGRHHLDAAAAANPASPANTADANGDVPGTATLTKTNPAGGDVATVSVNTAGVSDLKHTDDKGNFLSESKVNTNNPEQAYQQVNQLGNVISNFNISNDTFSGDGFCFNDSGLTLTDGNIFIGDNGTFSADAATDFISSDNSLTNAISNNYDTQNESYGATSYGNEDYLPVDVKAEVAADLASISGDPTADLDTLNYLKDLTGGRLNLDGKIADAEDREDRRVARIEHKAEKADRAQDPTVLDFAANDIFNSSAA